MNRAEVVEILDQEILRLHQVKQLLLTTRKRRPVLARLVAAHHPVMPRVISAEGRRRIVEAQKRRWAKQKRGKYVFMLKVKLLHPDAHAPTVSYAGSDLGFDLYALEDVVLQPGLISRVRTGIAVEGPPGFGFVLGDRSSMALKGITYLGGRIDAGYRGEILVCLMNVNQPATSLQISRNVDGHITGVDLRRSDVSVTISKGDKIIQMSLFRADTDRTIQIVDELGASSRDNKGFGSSGR